MIEDIKINDNTVIRSASQQDIDTVESNLRRGDFEECAIVGDRDAWHAKVQEFERCYSIWNSNKLVGYCGVLIPPGQTALTTSRWLCFLSTVWANSIKVSFVRNSRKVMKEIIARCPDYVEEFLSMPMADYRGSVIWHERVLKMHRKGECEILGHKHIIYTISRKDVE